MEKNKILKLLENQDFLKSIIKLETPEKVVEEFKKNEIDISTEQAQKIIEITKNTENKTLSDDELSEIAGGVNLAHRLSALGFAMVSVFSAGSQLYSTSAHDNLQSTSYTQNNFVKSNVDLNSKETTNTNDVDYTNSTNLGFINKITPLQLVANDKRETRIAVFEDTLKYCRLNRDKLGIELDRNGNYINTKSYSMNYNHNDFKESKIFKDSKISKDSPEAKIWLTNGKSLQSLNAVNQKLNRSNHALVLNFANYYHPGGGVARGCTAQEEALCRMTTLFPHLANAQMNSEFYYPHFTKPLIYGIPKTLRGWVDSGVFNQAIYTKDVKQIKDDYTVGRVGEYVDGPTFDVMTVAAPDLRETLAPMQEKNYKHFVKEQWRMIFATSFKEGRKDLVLGALGCGAFKNDPKIVSQAFYEVLSEKGPNNATWRQCFDNIILPIYVSKGSSDIDNYESFKNAHDQVYKSDNNYEEVSLENVD